MEPSNVPLIVWATRSYAVHSWLYYEKNSPMISDAQYDELCKYLLANWEEAKAADTNGYLNKEELECGSGYVTASKVAGITLKYAESLLWAQRDMHTLREVGVLPK